MENGRTMADVEQLRRVRIIGQGAVIAPRPGAWAAFPGDIIEVDHLVANGLIERGWAEPVEDEP